MVGLPGETDADVEELARIAARAKKALGAATVTVSLCLASVRFVVSERTVAAGIAYGLRTWVVQLALPIGFALVAFRILRRAGDGWRTRVATVALAGVLTLCAVRPPVPPSELVAPAFGLLLLATVLGAPIFSTLGGAGLILFWGDGSPIASLSVDHYGLVTNPTLPAVPLFTLFGPDALAQRVDFSMTIFLFLKNPPDAMQGTS